MDSLLLTALLDPTPFFTSWFSWLRPSTARARIRHDIIHVTNLMAANHAAANARFAAAAAARENRVQVPGFVGEGFGLEAVGGQGGPRTGQGFRRRDVARESESRRELVDGGATAAATFTDTAATISDSLTAPPPTTTRKSHPEEAARRYRAREAQRRQAHEVELSRKREQHRHQMEREKRARIEAENGRGIIVKHQRQHQHQPRSRKDEEQKDADRAWARSRRSAKMQCGGYSQQRNGGSAPSVWDVPKALPRGAARPGMVDMEAIWGEMPALGSGGTKAKNLRGLEDA